jgi:hypothetical protein
VTFGIDTFRSRLDLPRTLKPGRRLPKDVEVIEGADPDVDWGAGGALNLNHILARAERLGLDLRFVDFGELVVAPPPPPQ